MSRSHPLVFLALLSSIGCRDPVVEPALQERAWVDVAPDAATATATSTSTSTSTATSTSTSTSTEGEAATLDASPPAGSPRSRDEILHLLRPDESPSAEEALLLRAGLDALGEAPPSEQREQRIRRLLVAWMRRDAAGATALALGLPEDAREDALGELLPFLAASLEPAQMPALLGAAELPPLATHRLLSRCARDLASTYPDAARACHGALRDRGDHIALAIARDLAPRDEAMARIWVAAIRDVALRDEALAEIGAARGEGALNGIEDDALREWARAIALIRLAATRPQAALLGVDTVADPLQRAEVLEAVAWAWFHQGFPDLATATLKDAEATTALIPLRRAVQRAAGPAPAFAPPRTAHLAGSCDGLVDPHLIGACRTRAAEDAVARGDRDGARAALQTIPDDAWRAAALVPLFQGLDVPRARAWLRRSRALRDRLPPVPRDRHLLALLERCDLPPAARLRDGLALLEEPALRRQLIEDAGAQLDASTAASMLAGIADPEARALLCITVLEQALHSAPPPSS